MRSDQELIRAAQAGDEEAFTVLYERYRQWVVGLAFRLLKDRDEALDVLQDTFAVLLRRLPRFELRSRMTTFLYPVVRHLCLGRLRRDPSRAQGAPRDALAEGSSASEGPGALAAVLALLGEEHREVLVLRFVDGLDLAEIAQALEIPLGTVKSRLHHALRRLREDPRTKKLFFE